MDYTEVKYVGCSGLYLSVGGAAEALQVNIKHGGARRALSCKIERTEELASPDSGIFGKMNCSYISCWGIVSVLLLLW